MRSEIVIRTCDQIEDFYACVELERSIWRESDLETEPATMFAVASMTGGQVFGAFDGTKLVGFTLAVMGLRDSRTYIHSHMTGVDAQYRDRGVGRMLKLFQRQEALARGVTLIQWTFDPLELRNAHFNLDRLGAICRTYLANAYGLTTSPLHRGMATDRLVAEWHLSSPRVLAAIANASSGPIQGAAEIELPDALGEWMQHEPSKIQALQARVRAEFNNWFAKGYAVVATKATAAGRAYVLTPWSDS